MYLQESVIILRNEITNEELYLLVKQQLFILKQLCDKYDLGNTCYASEIALKIRVLLYNTKNCKSSYQNVLDRFALKPFLFPDSRMLSVFDEFKNTTTSIFSSKMIEYEIFVSPDSDGKIAPKQKKSTYNFWNFQDWWNKIIICQWNTYKITRQDLIQIMANQYGGAHIDLKIDERVLSIVRGLTPTIDLTIGIKEYGDKNYTVKKDLLFDAIIRTIADEVLYVFERKIMPSCEHKLKKNK